ncbi:transposase [Pseudorhodoferax sp. Leaf267]|uniref:IS91 family transposase n=1 Tax=Pseudorhodoferax sp. Leaf267 TaxID=1736316 RepID=UPI0021014821|nr:transposase [Pseudorhodoferax sp. Leaf267]
MVFALPASAAGIAYQNKAVLYGPLFDLAAEVLLTIAADPKHLGARIGATLVLHTWGSALTHHPHVHGLVPGGGLAPDGRTWVACRPGFFLPVRVLRACSKALPSRAVAAARGRQAAFLRRAGRPLRRTGLQALAGTAAPGRAGGLRQASLRWGQSVLAYLSRYTHLVAISNNRLLAMDERGVTFCWKD